MRWSTAFLLILCLLPRPARASRLKDLASIAGVRDNQLIGYGLVVGLAGTGDRRQTVFSAQTLTNMLERMGISVPSTAIRVTNTAAVMVTATLPPFSQPGTRIDLTASAIGDAASLQGGILLLTPLRGPDGQVYAAAQGPVVTGGFVAGGGGNRAQVNHPTVGRVPAGAIIERAAPSVTPTGKITWQLNRSDYTTAARIVSAINARFAGATPVARAESSGVVSVAIPESYAANSVQFIADLEALTVDADLAARIVINERTGTIVIGKDVTISPASIMHGALVVEVQTSTIVAPSPVQIAPAATVPETTLGVKEEKAKEILLKQGATVETLVNALRAIGATPRDVIAILQNLKAAGAISAEIEVM